MLQHVEEQIPFYLNGTLTPDERRQVEAHLAACAACQEELAFWQPVAAEVILQRAAAEVESAGQRPVLPALPVQAGPRSSPIARAWRLLLCQWPLIWRQILLASSVVLLGGLLALPSALAGEGWPALMILHWLAPMATALGVGLIYSPTEHELAELLRTQPTPPQAVLLARLALIFGSNALLVWLLALLLGGKGLTLAVLASEWLTPMAFLSSLALVMAVCFNAHTALSTAGAIWMLLGIAEVQEFRLSGLLIEMLVALSRPSGALPVTALLFALALWRVGHPPLPRHRFEGG